MPRVSVSTLTHGVTFQHFDERRFARRLRNTRVGGREKSGSKMAFPDRARQVAEWDDPFFLRNTPYALTTEVMPNPHTGKSSIVCHRVVYSDGVCSKCWYCGYDLLHSSGDKFGGFPIVMRLDPIYGKYILKGHFCTPACALGEIYFNSAYKNRARACASLTRAFYTLRYNIPARVPISPAPPRTCLKEYGGSLTIQEFRNVGSREACANGDLPWSVRDLPYPLTITHEMPRAEEILFEKSKIKKLEKAARAPKRTAKPKPRPKPKTKTKPEEPPKKLIQAGGSRMARRMFFEQKREEEGRPTEQGKAVWIGPYGRKRFISHWSKRDASRDADSKADDARAEYEIAKYAQTDGTAGEEVREALEKMNAADAEAEEARQKVLQPTAVAATAAFGSDESVKTVQHMSRFF